MTLIEVIVTVCIMGVLAAAMLPVVARSRSNARTISCQNNLRTLGQGMQVALSESSGNLPKVYYSFQGSNGNYIVSLKSPTNDIPDTFFKPGYSDSLVCPADDHPTPVLAYSPGHAAMHYPTGYAYNISLPLLFRNNSRLANPVNTVCFYDGDAGAVVGDWRPSNDWARDTVRFRHGGRANYLYMDGHVETLFAFPEVAFSGGAKWVSSAFPGGGAPAFTQYEPSASTTSTLPVVTTTTAAAATTTLAPGATTTISSPTTTRPPSTTTTTLPKHPCTGKVNIDPGGGKAMQFNMTAINGIPVTRDDLHADNPISGPGFNSSYLEYSGVATYIRISPGAGGNQNGLTLNGVTYALDNSKSYVITSNSMTVQLYNDKRKNGKAMGHWCIDIDAEDAVITVQ